MLGKRKEREENNFIEILCCLETYYSTNTDKYNIQNLEKKIIFEKIEHFLLNYISKFKKFENYILDNLKYNLDNNCFYLYYNEFFTDAYRHEFLYHINYISSDIKIIEINNNKILYWFDLLDIKIS